MHPIHWCTLVPCVCLALRRRAVNLCWIHEGTLLLQELKPFLGPAGDQRQVRHVLLPGHSSVYIRRQVPVMPSDLSLRALLAQHLLGQWAHVLKILALGAPVPSELNILDKYSLSRDQKCETNTLSRPQWSKEDIGLGEGAGGPPCSPPEPSGVDVLMTHMSILPPLI